MIYTEKDIIKIVNEALQHIVYNNVETLYTPVKYVIDNGGKRIRPTLLIMAYNLFKDDVETVVDNALALEIYHNLTLLHDDIMDKAEIRRGNPCVHIKWDLNTAIQAGDAMFCIAYRLMTENNFNLDAIKAFNEATIGVFEGQQYDIDFENNNHVTEEQYMEMIRLKTALLIATPLKIGAQLAGADKHDVEALYKFGEQIGLAFQLQDDMLDVYADTKLFGKNIGGDIVGNKKTFMLIKALEIAKDDRETLLKWIGKEVFDKDEKINAVKDIYDKLNIRDICQQKVNRFFDIAMKQLELVKVEEQRKRVLKEYALKLMDREA